MSTGCCRIRTGYLRDGARKVKQSIVGYGAAQKLAVAKMVQRMLHLPEAPEPDAADALALALTHAQEIGRISVTAKRKL